MKVIVGCVLAVFLIAGCSKESKHSDEPNLEPASSPVKKMRRIDASKKRPEIVPHEGPVTLQINHKENCVTLKPDGICYASLAELEKAAPNLLDAAGRENPARLAQVINALRRRLPDDQVFATQEEAQVWWSKWFDPQNAAKPESVILSELLPPLSRRDQNAGS